MIYGTMGRGQQVHSTPIYTNPSHTLVVANNEDISAWTESGFALTNEREALVQLKDDGVMLEVLCLQQTVEQQRMLMHDLDRLWGLEQVVAAGRQNWDTKYQRMEERQKQTIDRLHAAHVIRPMGRTAKSLVCKDY